jgi:intergrase/recombinase
MNQNSLGIIEETVYKKINCTDKIHTINLRKYLEKIRRKWENKAKKRKLATHNI